MKDKNLEEAENDEELGLNKQNKMSINTFDNINRQDEKKTDSRDTKEITTVGINSDNANTKSTKGKRKKNCILVPSHYTPSHSG